MILTWVGVIIVILIGLGIFLYVVYEEHTTKTTIILGIVDFLTVAAVCGALLWGLYGTESGKRNIKSFQSNTQGGITRSVRVFDMEGDLIAEYIGKFDIEHDEVRLVFDDENGQRHIIYFSTGTVLIDEIDDEEE